VGAGQLREHAGISEKDAAATSPVIREALDTFRSSPGGEFMGADEKKHPDVTNEKRCPHCGSKNVQYQGIGHGAGVGPAPPKIQKHQFKCASCEANFWYTGEFP
jgi:transposase-like protein